MFYYGILEGRFVDLRSAAEGDAEFTLKIRKDPEFIKFLPKIENTMEQQRAWIRYQQVQEGDYFFVVWNKRGERIGTIGLFDVKDSVCEAGRLAVRGNAFECIEAQLLSFQFAFNKLHVELVNNYIYLGNERALRFSKQFGGILIQDESEDATIKGGQICQKVIITKEDFEKAAKNLSTILYR